MPWKLERDEAFDKALKTYCKKLPNAEKDVLEAFENGPPRLNTNPLAGFQKKLWKARIRSSDLNQGKSGGLRVVYYWDEALPNWCCLGTCFPKNVREDLTSHELSRLFVNFKIRFDRLKQLGKQTEGDAAKDDG